MAKQKNPPRRGIEPRSPAWQAGILTTILSRIDEADKNQHAHNTSILFSLSLDHSWKGTAVNAKKTLEKLWQIRYKHFHRIRYIGVKYSPLLTSQAYHIWLIDCLNLCKLQQSWQFTLSQHPEDQVKVSDKKVIKIYKSGNTGTNPRKNMHFGEFSLYDSIFKDFLA